MMNNTPILIGAAGAGQVSDSEKYYATRRSGGGRRTYTRKHATRYAAVRDARRAVEDGRDAVVLHVHGFVVGRYTA